MRVKTTKFYRVEGSFTCSQTFSPLSLATSLPQGPWTTGIGTFIGGAHPPRRYIYIRIIVDELRTGCNGNSLPHELERGRVLHLSAS